MVALTAEPARQDDQLDRRYHAKCRDQRLLGQRISAPTANLARSLRDAIGADPMLPTKEINEYPLSAKSPDLVNYSYLNELFEERRKCQTSPHRNHPILMF
jgi:hypothetical protein